MQCKSDLEISTEVQHITFILVDTVSFDLKVCLRPGSKEGSKVGPLVSLGCFDSGYRDMLIQAISHIYPSVCCAS